MRNNEFAKIILPHSKLQITIIEANGLDLLKAIGNEFQYNLVKRLCYVNNKQITDKHIMLMNLDDCVLLNQAIETQFQKI